MPMMRPALLASGFRALSFRCCRSDKSNTKEVVGDGHGTRARVILESVRDHRGPAPSTDWPDSREPLSPKTGTTTRTRHSDQASERLSLSYAPFATRNLTPELSRPA